MEGLKNIMEDDVERQLNKLLPTMPNICSCDACKLDMATYALNRLKPNYVRSDKGELFHKVNTSSTQAKTELLTAVVTAINVIGSKPNHEPKESQNIL
ncbi:MAG: late competence development ComFB family protein [Lachnospiraceae bacterium]|nr:late competence development ComFB family protein [Lachnospiraceae bacterium]